jgi:peptidoglycan/xylan/chitin deacetylase (PgdA/CDA1 family)
VRRSALETLRSARARVNEWTSRRALILLYHRVAETESDPWGLAVSPKHFEEQLQVLRQYASIIPLSALCDSIDRARLPRRSFVVTFDDGYADNLLNAKPLLEKYDVPAMVFITAGYTGGDREFWWDELDRLFLLSDNLPDTLRLRINGKYYHWDIENDHQAGAGACHQNWRACQEDAEPHPRHALYMAIWELMHQLPEHQRNQIRNELIEWTISTGKARSTHRPLSEEQLIELTGDGLIEAGCHTVTHPKLASLDQDSQRDEIVRSKKRLEEILDRPVKYFAYPYGQERDYTEETVRIVREEGFTCGCATSVGFVGRDADPFQLPRLQVPDIDGESFERLLTSFRI